MDIKKHSIATEISVKDEGIEPVLSQLKERGENLIINFGERPLSKEEVSELTLFSEVYKKNQKKSFVIVNEILSYDEVGEELSLVPTLQEALDTIEMEEIERDLGF